MCAYKKHPLCKPCWELKYCPYGLLVEMMPLPRTPKEDAEYRKESAYVETASELFERAKRTLQGSDFKNDDEVWNNMFFVMYADPGKWEYLSQYNPRDLACSIYGHSCPVFFFGEPGTTETRETRRTGRFIPRDVMLKVVRRDDYRCQKCGEQVRDDEVEFDHIIPHSKGGPLTVENIRLLCRACNRKKSDSLAELLEPPFDAS